MSLVDAHIGLTLRYTYLEQKCQNEFMYFTEGAVFVGVNAVQVAEAWWNDIKTDFRAMVGTPTDVARIQSVVCRNLVVGGELGEYAIPVGEQAGTRSFAGLADAAPSFVNMGFRMTVGNTTTRPGQKRFPFLWEGDMERNRILDPMLALLETFAAHVDSPLTLGAPVAAGVLQPVVGGTIDADGFPTVYQDVVGHLINTNITSQVSRKLGHGS